MKLPGLITLLFLYFVGNLFGQTVVKGIVTDDANQTIPFVAVYLSKTTIGTMTNKDGAYTLTIPQEGVYELISSCLGFTTKSQMINVEGKNLSINIKMSENLIQLDEVTVKSKDKNREKNYAIFTKLFLGETINSLNCRILNPEDLYLYRVPNTNVLKGQSLKSLRIENKSLGYLIHYDLSDFSFDEKSEMLRYTGSPYFQPLDGSSKEMKKWVRNRLSAYYGSRLHLLRSIYTDSLKQAKFQLFQAELDPSRKDTVKITPIRETNLRFSRTQKQMRVYSSKPVLVNYVDTHAELYNGLFGFLPQRYKSALEFSDTVTVYQNGFYPNPYSVTWSGKMAGERMADMVPFDFLSYSTTKFKSDTMVTAPSIENILTSGHNSTCGDQLFVHLDRNIYRPGDTIFFQAYVRDRFSAVFRTTSVHLYALLFNSSRILADSSRYKIENSTTSGWMTIPAKAEPGKYHFAAFTSQMQNNNPVEAFQVDLLVKESGNNPGKKPLTAEVNVPVEVAHLDLRFLPEGGSFIHGIEQRVGFNATNEKGEAVAIEGLLKNSLGSILDTIRSGPFGPGSFSCTAISGLFVELTKGAAGQKRWPLPEPTITGFSLGVAPAGNRSVVVDIQSSMYTGEKVIVTGTLNMVRFFSQEVNLTKRQQIIVDTGSLPSGVANITLFDPTMKPVAERLIYLNSDKHLQFSIQPGTQVSHPGEETELSISVTDGVGKPSEGFFSIAVTDSVRGIDSRLFSPGIEYTFNYHPVFPGNLPPRILAYGLENLSDAERDLLLMVYGWSKISWDFKPMKSDSIQPVNYDLLKLKVLYEGRNKRERSLDLVSLEGASSRHLVTDESGEILLPLDSLSGITRSVIMMPDVKSKNKATGAMLSIPYNEQYFKSNKLHLQQPLLPVHEYHNPASEQPVAMEEKTIEIAEVTIIGHQTEKIYKDEYERIYQADNVKSLDYEPLWSSSTLETAIRKLVYPYSITTANIYLRSTISFMHGPLPALIVLDGMPLYDQGWSRVNTISPSEVTSLTILDSRMGYVRYGEAAQGGVIFINTRSSDPNLARVRTKWNLQNSNDKMLRPINLYRPSVEFYNPSKVELESNPLLQSRPTIFWQSEVYFGGKEPVKIKFPNLKHKGPVVITVNGVSVDNLIGSGRGRYVVE